MTSKVEFGVNLSVINFSCFQLSLMFSVITTFHVFSYHYFSCFQLSLLFMFSVITTFHVFSYHYFSCFQLSLLFMISVITTFHDLWIKNNKNWPKNWPRKCRYFSLDRNKITHCISKWPVPNSRLSWESTVTKTEVVL